jgi:hypothetical protein
LAGGVIPAGFFVVMAMCERMVDGALTSPGQAGPRTDRPLPLLSPDDDLDFYAKDHQDYQQEEKMC